MFFDTGFVNVSITNFSHSNALEQTLLFPLNNPSEVQFQSIPLK